MKSSKWLARRGKTVRWRVPWTMDVFAFVRVAEMSAAHKAFWLPLSQQSDTASDLGLIRWSIHNRKTRHVEKLLEPLCWWYPSRFDNADSYLQQPHFLNLSLGALDFRAIASWLTSTNLQTVFGCQQHKLPPTVRAKWRELGDPCKRGDDIHDVNGTGPVAAEHQNYHNLPQSATSVTLRNSEVQSAWSLKPQACVHVMPGLHTVTSRSCRLCVAMHCHSIRGCLKPLRAKWLWLWAGRCGRADLENGSHDVSGLRTCCDEDPLTFIQFPGSSVEEALQPLDPLCPETDCCVFETRTCSTRMPLHIRDCKMMVPSNYT